MFVCIVGGFLGSGKTTLLMRMGKGCVSSGLKVAILVNEMGEVGIDGTTLKADGYDAVEIPGGCICCSLSGTLQHALRSIEKDYHPDIIIIEPTGMAFPHKVSELVRTSMIDSDRTVIVGVVDAHRFDELIKERLDFFNLQIKASDIILLNKVDMESKETVGRIAETLMDTYRDKEIILASAKTGQGIDYAISRVIN